MDTILGLLGLFLFVVVITSLAAGVTWLVVRLFPPQDKEAAARELVAGQTGDSGRTSSSGA